MNLAIPVLFNLVSMCQLQQSKIKKDKRTYSDADDTEIVEMMIR